MVQNDFMRFFIQFIRQIPVPFIEEQEGKNSEFVGTATLGHEGVGDEAVQIEREINQIVYRLFELSREEIKIIEDTFTN